MRSPLLQPALSAALVTSGRPWRRVEVHDALASTNDRAAQLARDEAVWSVVLAEHQTGGRGRLGRPWEVPRGASVSLSVVVPAPPARELGWVPLLAGVALARALATVTGRAAAGPGLEARLKWPNDVLLPADGSRKVAGILSELVLPTAGALTGGGTTGACVVIGTGVNVDQTRDELPVPTATSLHLAGAGVDRHGLVVAYLDELVPLLGAASDGTGADGRAAYRRLCATIGSQVRIHLPGDRHAEGLAVGVDDGGGLVVRVGETEQTFAVGDVVHVRPGLA